MSGHSSASLRTLASVIAAVLAVTICVAPAWSQTAGRGATNSPQAAAPAAESTAPTAAAPAAPAATASAAPERPTVEGVLTGNNVYVRQGPGTEYPSYFRAQIGYPVKVLTQKGNWFEIEFPGVGFSWVSKDMMQPIDAETGIVINANVNVRSGPGQQYDVLYTVPTGHKFKVVGADPLTQAWYHVEPMQGATAWISADYVRLAGVVPGNTAEIAPAPVTAEAAATGGPRTTAPAADSASKMARAEEMFRAETAKANPVEWDLDALKSMYEEISIGSTDPMEKAQAGTRLLQIEAYGALKARAAQLGKVDEDLKSRLSELEQQRQAEILAAAAAGAKETPYAAIGMVEKFYLSGFGGATHKLVRPDGSIAFLLKSDVLNISTLEGRKVGVKGKFITLPGQNVRIIDVTSSMDTAS